MKDSNIPEDVCDYPCLVVEKDRQIADLRKRAEAERDAFHSRLDMLADARKPTPTPRDQATIIALPSGNWIVDKEIAADFVAMKERLVAAEREIKGNIDNIPVKYRVRVREGGGPEDYHQTLAVSLYKVVQALKDAESDVAKLQARLASQAGAADK